MTQEVCEAHLIFFVQDNVEENVLFFRLYILGRLKFIKNSKLMFFERLFLSPYYEFLIPK